jgi:hypothetical protein
MLEYWELKLYESPKEYSVRPYDVVHVPEAHGAVGAAREHRALVLRVPLPGRALAAVPLRVAAQVEIESKV